jgi:hypothetical protein
MPKPSTKALINEIQSDDIEQAFMRLTKKACEWAVSGFLSEANKLLEAQWSYEQEHSGHLWLPDEGFQVMWEVSNIIPSAKIPFDFKNIEDIESENWSRICPSWTEAGTLGRAEKTLKGLTGFKLYAKAISSIDDKSETITDILEALKDFIGSEDAVGYSYFQATSCAAVFAARSGFEKEALEFIELWGNGYLKYSSNYSLSYLMRDRATALLLLKGTLSQTFGLTDKICKKELEDIKLVLSERFANGRTLVYASLSWKELLENISVKAIEQQTLEFSNEITQSKWLGKEPATLDDIKQAQKKLSVILPPDYIEFLLTSNGFESVSFNGITIAPIDKIDLLVNVDEELVDIWTDAMFGIDDIFNELFSKSIIIGGHEQEQKLLLIQLGKDAWECWSFGAAHAAVKYPDFRFYIEELLQRLDDGFYTD